MSHYPVVGWLRVACGFLQRCTAAEKIGWDEQVSAETRAKVDDIVKLLREEGDPAKGQWLVDNKQPAVLWTDASSQALGVVLEVGGTVVEDAAWLRKRGDTAHINMSELDAVIRGVNLCLKWNIRQFTIKTDSATAFGWLKSVFEKTHRVKTHALSEMLIRRRLEILSELVEQEQLVVQLEQVASEHNKADRLTRVPRKWLETGIAGAAVTAVAGDLQPSKQEVALIHSKHHFGVDRMLELLRERFASVDRKTVKEVVNEYRQCAMIDPAVNFWWQSGTIASDTVWEKLAVDITHVNGQPYLSCIDCGSRFTIWRPLKNESSKEICVHLERIFAEMGPPAMLLSDNGPAFRGIEMQQLLEVWDVQPDYSCAYRAQGNGLVERVHRTIKRMVARSGRGVAEMVFW